MYFCTYYILFYIIRSIYKLYSQIKPVFWNISRYIRVQCTMEDSTASNSLKKRVSILLVLHFTTFIHFDIKCPNYSENEIKQTYFLHTPPLALHCIKSIKRVSFYCMPCIWKVVSWDVAMVVGSLYTNLVITKYYLWAINFTFTIQLKEL